MRTKAKPYAAATDHMARIKVDPDRVNSYFQDSRVKYVARKHNRARSIASRRAIVPFRRTITVGRRT
jgi:hypothetical protein